MNMYIKYLLTTTKDVDTLQKRLENVDYYNFLSVSRDAPSTEIYKSFAKIMEEFKPGDIFSENYMEKSLITTTAIKAFCILGDQEKKQEYDLRLSQRDYQDAVIEVNENGSIAIKDEFLSAKLGKLLSISLGSNDEIAAATAKKEFAEQMKALQELLKTDSLTIDIALPTKQKKINYDISSSDTESIIDTKTDNNTDDIGKMVDSVVTELTKEKEEKKESKQKQKESVSAKKKAKKEKHAEIREKHQNAASFRINLDNSTPPSLIRFTEWLKGTIEIAKEDYQLAKKEGKTENLLINTICIVSSVIMVLTFYSKVKEAMDRSELINLTEYYTVQEHDTLSEIADSADVPVSILLNTEGLEEGIINEGDLLEFTYGVDKKLMDSYCEIIDVSDKEYVMLEEIFEKYNINHTTFIYLNPEIYGLDEISEEEQAQLNDPEFIKNSYLQENPGTIRVPNFDLIREHDETQGVVYTKKKNN